jgi:hypothetical protein
MNSNRPQSTTLQLAKGSAHSELETGAALEELRHMRRLAAAVKRKDPVKWATLDESQNPCWSLCCNKPNVRQTDTVSKRTLFSKVYWSLFHKRTRKLCNKERRQYGRECAFYENRILSLKDCFVLSLHSCLLQIRTSPHLGCFLRQLQLLYPQPLNIKTAHRDPPT